MLVGKLGPKHQTDLQNVPLEDLVRTQKPLEEWGIGRGFSEALALSESHQAGCVPLTPKGPSASEGSVFGAHMVDFCLGCVLGAFLQLCSQGHIQDKQGPRRKALQAELRTRRFSPFRPRR